MRLKTVLIALVILFLGAGLAIDLVGGPFARRRVRQGISMMGGGTMLKFPGESFKGTLPALTEREVVIRDALEQDLQALCGTIGERQVYRYPQLVAAANFIEASFKASGYTVARQSFQAKGRDVCNLEVEIRGSDRAAEVFIVGAHYDTVPGSPGANDNGSGVAALLRLANLMHGKPLSRTLRFVAFVNEEQPYFHTEMMGSLVYAQRCRQRRENIVGMFSLETMGYYTDAPNTQNYPPPLSMFYPSTGNFIGFVGNTESTELLKDTVASFRRHAKFPSEGGALPANVDGVGWSDHWSFWQQGYQAVEVTDTALFRYPYYHKAQDTPDKIVYDRFARVVAGLEKVLEDLTGMKTVQTNAESDSTP